MIGSIQTDDCVGFSRANGALRGAPTLISDITATPAGLASARTTSMPAPSSVPSFAQEMGAA
ncbi:MAG: hypothetical protein WB615_01630 [Candidatus Tumulicola sp.]